MTDNLVFPWARSYDADQLGAFIEDLWGAAAGDNDLATLDAIEKVIAEHRPEGAAVRNAPPCPLSPWHLRLLERIANGDTQTAAARALGMSLATVRVTLTQIYGWIGANHSTHAAVLALQYGWLAAEAIQRPQPRNAPWRYERKSPQAWKAMYQEHAAALRARPGEWLPIGPYKSSVNAERAADRISKAFMDPYLPAGDFEAEAVIDDGEWMVRARYVGTTHNTAPGGGAR